MSISGDQWVTGWGWELGSGPRGEATAGSGGCREEREGGGYGFGGRSGQEVSVWVE